MPSYLRILGVFFTVVLLAVFVVALAPGSAEAESAPPTGPTAGVLEVCKETEPDGDTAGFAMRLSRNAISGGTAVTANTFSGMNDGECQQYTWIAADQNVNLFLREHNMPAGWKIKDVQCSTAGLATVGAWSANADNVQINITSVSDGVRCTFTNEKGAIVKVEKDTEPNDAVKYYFDLTGASTFGQVNRTDGQNATAFDDNTVASDSYVAPGDYTLSETMQFGYDVSITCSSSTGSPVYTPDNVNGKTTLTVVQGETLTCTFTNTQRGEIIVKKVVVADPDYTGDSSFNFTFTPPAPGVPSNFPLKDTESWSTGLIPPEDYTVEETTEVGWETTWSCSDSTLGTGGKIDIVLDPGEKLECIFTNTLKAGKIRIIKQTEPDGDPQTFDITIKDPLGAVVKNCPAVGDDDKCTTGLNPGMGYKASEVKVPGWDLEQNYGKIVCSNGSKANNITVDPGKTTTCTFVNWKRAKLTVSKVAIPEVAGAAKTFDFALSGAPTNAFSNWPELTLPLPFQLNGGGMWESDPWLKPGTYSVAEGPPPSGWFFQSAECKDASNVTVAGPANIALGPGMEVVCTFTNVNPKPTNLALSKLNVAENRPVGTLVGYLTADDPGDDVSFALSPVDGTAASAGNNFFQIVKARGQWKLLTKIVFDYEKKKAHSIVVIVTDSAGNETKKQFTISILNVRDPN